MSEQFYLQIDVGISALICQQPFVAQVFKDGDIILAELVTQQPCESAQVLSLFLGIISFQRSPPDMHAEAMRVTRSVLFAGLARLRDASVKNCLGNHGYGCTDDGSKKHAHQQDSSVPILSL